MLYSITTEYNRIRVHDHEDYITRVRVHGHELKIVVIVKMNTNKTSIFSCSLEDVFF